MFVQVRAELEVFLCPPMEIVLQTLDHLVGYRQFRWRWSPRLRGMKKKLVAEKEVGRLVGERL
jgi:hypothetical protein